MTDAGRDEASVADARSRRPRRRIALAVAVVAIVALGGLVRWASRPQQVAALVLSQAGRALGLRITAEGVSEYTLRGGPRIVLRNVAARRDGDPTPVLQADRILLSVAWSTIRSRGREVTVHRVELDRPRLDIGALQRWLATRPPTPQRAVPTLTDGFVVGDGRVTGDGWSIDAIAMQVPSLAPGRIVRAHLRGRAIAGDTRIPFDLAATLARPALPAGLGIAGEATVQRADWQLPMSLVLRGQPRLDPVPALDGLAMGARARYVSGSTSLPFRLGIGGRASLAQGLRLEPFGLALRQGREIPNLTAGGRVAWGSQLALALDGRIARWPDGWPELPAPFGRPKGPLPLRLAYDGATDLSGRTDLHLESGATVFDGRFRLPRVLEWLDAAATGTPLPPLDGRLSTPRLEIPGATLEGVEVEVRDDGE